MGRLTKAERFLQELVEGPFARLEGRRLQPVTLAKRLLQELDESARTEMGGTLVANRYTITVSPKDHAELAPYLKYLENNLREVVEAEARERGAHLAGRPLVVITADEEIPAGQVEAIGLIAVDEDVLRPAGRLTQSLSGVVAAAPTKAYLVADGVRRFPLEKERVSVGRAADNDLVLSESQVSRHHAEVFRRDGRWWVRDLGSRHGTQVNGLAPDKTPLRDGDRIDVGGVAITFTTRAG